MNRTSLLASALPSILVLAACAAQPSRPGPSPFLASDILASSHIGSDDLLTAGLGATGLRSPVPPAFANADAPTAIELRRRAIWTNWRGIADLAPGGGFGELYGSLAPVPGREFQALAKVAGASQPHRVLVQLPDAFDTNKRCVLVAASSGSRGIYGAIALAGSWGLSHGCAVAYTDKGAGTGYVDTATGSGAALDGTRVAAGGVMEFSAPRAPADAPARIAVKHAHSGDNPEADWGQHVQQAAQFALQVLDTAHPEAAPFNAGNTRVIAVGVSNGGGAVLRAAELSGDEFDGVVAVSPNVYSPEGGRALFDYATEAALLMPCALNAPVFDGVALARPGAVKSVAGSTRCASLHQSGQLKGTTADAQAQEALDLLHAGGWTDGAIAAGAISTSFDLWRAVAVTYASAYARTPAHAMPCGYAFQATDAKGVPQAPSAAAQAAWWSDSAGIPPGQGVGIHDGMAAGADPFLPGLQCLRGLWADEGAMPDRVRAGVAATRARLPRVGLPVIVVHGADDGLVPEAFSGGAYAAAARTAGRDLRYWRIANAQHFDAFLGLPVLGASYVPMLPYAYRALDRMWSRIESGAALPASAEISTRKRALGPAGLAPLSAEDLALP